MRLFSLYVHIPFCARSCPYCSFYHVPHSREREKRFVDAACAEIRRIPQELDREVGLHTVYFGGGTPSLLDAASFRALRSSLDPFMPNERPVEFTIELNPEDVDESLLVLLRGLGVNRISLGVQSMDAAAQRTLRRCSPRTNQKALSLLEKHFDNVNVDVLVGIPGCGTEEAGRTMEMLAAFQPRHFSVYCLERSEGECPDGASFFDGVDADASADQYLFICGFLKERGCRHYEVSNFAVPGHESLHNLAYWSGAEYVGIGPAAHSFTGGRRYGNGPSLEEYLSAAERGERPLRIHDDGKRDRLLESVMLSLRTDRGVPVDRIEPSSRIIEELIEGGLAGISGGRLVLNDRGFLLLDEIVVKICEACGGSP